MPDRVRSRRGRFLPASLKPHPPHGLPPLCLAREGEVCWARPLEGIDLPRAPERLFSAPSFVNLLAFSAFGSRPVVFGDVTNGSPPNYNAH